MFTNRGGGNSCMFSGIKACSRDYFGFTGIVCNKHASDIFEIKTITNHLCGRKNFTSTSVSITADYPICDILPILPFPIKLKVDAVTTGPFTNNGRRLCIDKDGIYNTISNFLVSKDMNRKGYGSEDVRRISQILVTYISSGNFQAQENIQGLTYYGDASTPKYAMFSSYNTSALEAYWAKRRTDETLVGIVDDNGYIINFPVVKMPLFYQAMFVNFEFSHHTYSNTANANTTGHYLIPNVIADTKTSSVHTFNVTQDNEIYRCTDNSTYSTPLIFHGIVRHLTNSHFEPFQKPEVLPGSFASLDRPGFCN